MPRWRRPPADLKESLFSLLDLERDRSYPVLHQPLAMLRLVTYLPSRPAKGAVVDAENWERRRRCRGSRGAGGGSPMVGIDGVEADQRDDVPAGLVNVCGKGRRHRHMLGLWRTIHSPWLDDLTATLVMRPLYIRRRDRPPYSLYSAGDQNMERLSGSPAAPRVLEQRSRRADVLAWPSSFQLACGAAAWSRETGVERLASAPSSTNSRTLLSTSSPGRRGGRSC